MAKLLKKSAKYTKEELLRMARVYDEISSKMKELDKTKKMLSDKIKEATEELGVKDDKGSFYFELDNVVTGKVAKKSVSLNEDKAKELFKKKGIYDDVVEVIEMEQINESALEEKINDGVISDEEFESICDIKTSYSVSVKEKEDMPEVEVTELKAASKK